MEILNKSIIQETLRDSLAPLMKRNGFKYSKQIFIYEDELRIVFVGVRLVKRTYTSLQTFMLDPYVHIHVKPVENIYRQITFNKYLISKELFITVGNRLFELESFVLSSGPVRGMDYDFIPLAIKEIAAVCEHISTKMEQIAFPYVNRVASLESIEFLLNKDPFIPSLHMTNNVYRVVKGILLAKLVRRNELYISSLIGNYLLVSKNFNEEARMEVKRAINFEI